MGVEGWLCVEEDVPRGFVKGNMTGFKAESG